MKRKLLVEGMRCINCARHLKEALEEDVNNLKVLDVDLENKFALVELNSSVSENFIREVVEDLGYELKGIE